MYSEGHVIVSLERDVDSQWYVTGCRLRPLPRLSDECSRPCSTDFEDEELAVASQRREEEAKEEEEEEEEEVEEQEEEEERRKEDDEERRVEYSDDPEENEDSSSETDFEDEKVAASGVYREPPLLEETQQLSDSELAKRAQINEDSRYALRYHWQDHETYSEEEVKKIEGDAISEYVGNLLNELAVLSCLASTDEELFGRKCEEVSSLTSFLPEYQVDFVQSELFRLTLAHSMVFNVNLEKEKHKLEQQQQQHHRDQDQEQEEEEEDGQYEGIEKEDPLYPYIEI